MEDTTISMFNNSANAVVLKQYFKRLFQNNAFESSAITAGLTNVGSARYCNIVHSVNPALPHEH